MAGERIQKLIARSGRCSRREADRLVGEGRVTVNGRVAKPGDRADGDNDFIKVDGKALRRPAPQIYLLVYKPRRVMTTCDDPEERTTVLDLIRGTVRQRVFPVGRLDYNSEGLIVLTNDGDLAARISHPRHGIVREYLVKVRGDLDAGAHRQLMRGAEVDGHHVRPLRARRDSVTRGNVNSWWRVEVAEGRTHEVRELFFRVGHPVQRLRRVAIGPLRDDELRPGEFRSLTDEELRALRAAGDEKKPRSGRRTAAASPTGRRSRRPRKGRSAG